jgi:hypothetical protein
MRPALALAALLLAPPAAAGPVDLTAYLTGFPVAGDFKIFERSDGSVSREETVRVETIPGGWAEEARYLVDGEVVGGALAFVLPGRKSVLAALAIEGVVIELAPPGWKQPLRLEPGRPRRARAHGRAEIGGRRVGSARGRSDRTFVGFEPKDTPLASYPDTARIESTSTLRLKNRLTGEVAEVREVSTAWFAPGIGRVASEVQVTGYLDGVLVTDTGPLTTHFVSGRLGGLPIP